MESSSAPEVNSLRSDLLESCREAGAWEPGVYTLSAPTGTGKTLAMLAFALRHAIANNLQRIVLAVPFLSIIEQTVRVYRKALAPILVDNYLLEHHSLAGTRGKEDDGQDKVDLESRRLAEHWDSPLIVTTSVQLLESLFANRPSTCRKLHNLAESVILLDEVQTLPPVLAAPTLASLSHLAHRYRSSIVFATATQPAFQSLQERVLNFAASGWRPREIVPGATRSLRPRPPGPRDLGRGQTPILGIPRRRTRHGRNGALHREPQETRPGADEATSAARGSRPVPPLHQSMSRPPRARSCGCPAAARRPAALPLNLHSVRRSRRRRGLSSRSACHRSPRSHRTGRRPLQPQRPFAGGNRARLLPRSRGLSAGWLREQRPRSLGLFCGSSAPKPWTSKYPSFSKGTTKTSIN